MKSAQTTMLKVVQLIVDKLAVDQNLLSYETSFADDLGADSLDVYELISAIEKEFAFKIDVDDADRLATVGSIIDYVDDKVSIQAESKTKAKRRTDIIMMNRPVENTATENVLELPRI